MINALLVMLADVVIPDFALDGFWIALLFSIVVSLVNSFFHLALKDKR